MRILILIFSLIFGGSGIAQDFREYGFAMMTDSKCDNHEEAMKYLKKVVKIFIKPNPIGSWSNQAND